MASELSNSIGLETTSVSAKNLHAARAGHQPVAQGLYRPSNERDACGVGFVAHIKGKKVMTS